jgi:pimeloyl-ACP methyl ester carboxylesterase
LNKKKKYFVITSIIVVISLLTIIAGSAFLWNTRLTADRYSYVKANPSLGFHWDYLLYTPETVKSPYLLVIPNNSGNPNSDMAFHQTEAKKLIQDMRDLADGIGTFLLVPIFPRPAGELNEYYTHNLDRDVLLMTFDGYQRIDLQLLAMVDDARNKLAERRIQIDQRFIMWGFSASGTFSDRFSLLHPDRLVAVAAGGCTHSLPFATYAGENLPYPVGTYDYESIMGAPFDAKAFASLPRFLYKSDQDSGGTITTNDGVYPADEYFDLFVRGELEANLKTSPIPLITSSEMSHSDEDLLKYRIYRGAVFVDEFIAVSKIYAEAGLDKSQFKLYPGVGHEITDEMKKDVREFFLANIR